MKIDTFVSVFAVIMKIYVACCLLVVLAAQANAWSWTSLLTNLYEPSNSTSAPTAIPTPEPTPLVDESVVLEADSQIGFWEDIYERARDEYGPVFVPDYEANPWSPQSVLFKVSDLLVSFAPQWTRDIWNFLKGIGIQGKLLLINFDTTTAEPVDTTTAEPVVPTTTPYPGKLIQGDIVTTENYTVGLDDPSSAAFLTFEKNFTNAMKTFYDGTAFSALYDGVSIVQLSNTDRQVVIWFEVRVSELVPASRPNALTVLAVQLQTNSLGKFRVISHSLSIPS